MPNSTGQQSQHRIESGNKCLFMDASPLPLESCFHSEAGRTREGGLKQDAWLMQCAPSLPAWHLSNHRPACWVALRQHCEKLTGKGLWEHPGSAEIRTICIEKEVPPAQCCRTVPERSTQSLKLNLSSRWFVTRESLLCFDNHDMVPTAAVCSTLQGVSLDSFDTVHFPEGKMLM